MKKYILTFFITILFTLNVSALEISLESEKVLLYNLKDEEILYEKNSEINTNLASLTKVITVLVALENINNLNEKVKLTDEVFYGFEQSDAALAGFLIGEEVTYKDLLYGAMLPSGADATKALAINLFGTEAKFVSKMNDFVQKLGLTNTRFTNTSGLDEQEQKATLKDYLAIILYALKNKDFVEIFNSREYTTSTGRLNFKSTINNYSTKYNLNTLIILGGKTGYTDLAGLCLVSYAQKDDMELLLITTNAPVMEPFKPYNVVDALNVYNYYFENYNYQTLLNKNSLITKVSTKYSKQKEVELFYKGDDIKLFLPNNYDRSLLKLEYSTDDYILGGTANNTVVGTFDLYFKKEKLLSGDLILDNHIEFSFQEFIKFNIIWCIVIFIFLASIIYFLIFKTKIFRKKNRKKGI